MSDYINNIIKEAAKYKGFTIRCNNCGKEITVKKSDFVEKIDGIEINCDTFETYNIKCDCGNKTIEKYQMGLNRTT